MLLKISLLSSVLFVSLSFTNAHECKEHGYTHVEGVGWYKAHTRSKPWLEASKVCAKEGAHLAVINSEKENQAIIDILDKERLKLDARDRAYRWDMAWVGGHKVIGKNGKEKWVTIFGQPLSESGYTRWSQKACYGFPPEPNNQMGNENCLSVFLKCDQGLNDQSCGSYIDFICEKYDTCEEDVPEVPRVHYF